MAKTSTNQRALDGSLPDSDRSRWHMFLVAVVLGSSCSGCSCPRWQMSWVAVVL